METSEFTYLVILGLLKLANQQDKKGTCFDKCTLQYLKPKCDNVKIS